MLDSATVQSAVGGKYSEFSNLIKRELKTKVSQHPVYQDYDTENAKLSSMRNAFKEISNFTR